MGRNHPFESQSTVTSFAKGHIALDALLISGILRRIRLNGGWVALRIRAVGRNRSHDRLGISESFYRDLLDDIESISIARLQVILDHENRCLFQAIMKDTLTE
jgi:hypothetical protein